MSKNHVILKIDPITRIEGHLGMFVKVDPASRKVIDAYTIAIMFRGFEIILKGRYPDSAIFITSRSCGVCGAAHANASVLACDMALGVPPTPLGAALRNLAYAMTDYIYDHSVLLGLLEGPDYSQLVVSELTPSVFEKAKEYKCEHARYHGYKTIADMMYGWNPVPKPGITYALTAYAQRLAKEAGTLIYGKYPHPASLVPGGVCFDFNLIDKVFTFYLQRLAILTIWAKFIVTQWYDMLKFYDTVEVSEGKTYTSYMGLTYEPAVMLSAGLFENPLSELYWSEKEMFAYDEVYREIDKAYSERFHKPGFAVGSDVKYGKFTDMQRNMIEITTSGYYHHEREFMGRYVTEHDPAGKPLAGGIPELVQYHEWNKETIPKPGPMPKIPEEWRGEKYSWCAEVRMVLEAERALVPFEAGPIAKLWVHALISHEPFKELTEKMSKEYGKVIELEGFDLKAGGGKIEITLPSVDQIRKAIHDIVEEAKSILGKSIPEVEVPDIPLIGRDKLPDLYGEPLTIKWWNDKSTTMYRLYARAFSLACAVLGAWWTMLALLAVLREKGHKWYGKPGRPWRFPSYPAHALGVGWLEAPRGAVRHWIVVENTKIANYQYHAPTTGNASPRTQMKYIYDELKVNVKLPREIGIKGAVDVDYYGKHVETSPSLISPYEAAAFNCYITEERSPDRWNGLDIVRAIRSFDPCIGCAVHVDFINIRKITKHISPIYWTY